MVKRIVCCLGLLVLVIGCSIEESAQGVSGAVRVTAVDSTGSPVDRARISVDGQPTTQFTPAEVKGLSPGSHIIGISRPDVWDAADTVEIVFNQSASLSLVTSFKPLGAVNLGQVPDSTTLLVNNYAAGITPPAVLFTGVGTYFASAFLKGHATGLPAQWSITVTQGDTATLPVSFTAVTEGDQAGSLARLFALADDRDSAIYRLQDYRGKVLLVNFFFVTCAPCIAEFPYIQAVYSDPAYAGKIEFFGIDPNDSYFDFALFRTVYHPELGLQFPLLYGQGQGVKEAYGVVPFPANFIIDQTGVIRYRLGGVTETQLREVIDALLAEAR